MKMQKPHAVPLSDAAVAILRNQEAERGKNPYVFPGARPRKPLSIMAMTMTLRRLGRGSVTVHGMRSAARSWMADNGVEFELAEACLAHTVGNAVVQAYQRSSMLERRRPVMQAWASLLTCGADPKVVSLSDGRKRCGPVGFGSGLNARKSLEVRARFAFQNKPAVYDLLFRTAAETLTTIAADPKHLGARIGLTAVLHTWGSALTHHPHIHVIVLGGGLSPDGSRWIACKPAFFPPVHVLSRLFRRLFLEGLAVLHEAGLTSSSTPANEKVRESGVVTSQAVLIAVGIGWDGRRQILAVDMSNRESSSSWRDFLIGLRRRGLPGVEFVVADDHAAARDVRFALEAARQRAP